MADNWDGNPQTWSNEVFGDAKLNREIRDRFDAVKAGLTDSSVDADIKQAVKAGTLALRPAASLAGRQYFATDILASFVDDGTRWQHLSGRGVFDSFDRATSTTLGNAESGHPWIEEAGDIQINASAYLENVSGTAIATVDTGGVLHSADYIVVLASGGTVGSFDASVVLKYIDASNFLYLQLNGTTASLQKREAAVGTALASATVTFTASTSYLIKAHLYGSVSWIEIYNYSTKALLTLLAHDDDENLMGGYINTATKCGVRLLNTTNSLCSMFSVKPN